MMPRWLTFSLARVAQNFVSIWLTFSLTFTLIGGKWKILILCAMDKYGTIRYGELRRVIAGITNTMLAQSLRELETDGLIRRTVYDGRPVRVDYDLTDKTEVLIPILLELQAWGEQNIQGPKQ